MLDHILRQAFNFERRHGVAPNVIFINDEHYAALRENAPGLFSDPPTIAMGFELRVISKESLSHPHAVRLESARDERSNKKDNASEFA